MATEEARTQERFPTHLKDVLDAQCAKLQRYRPDPAAPPPLTGLPTGFRNLDELLGGLQPGELTVIAGYPGSGKTSLALNIVNHAGCVLGLSAAIFSLEAPNEAVAIVLGGIQAGTNVRDISGGKLIGREIERLQREGLTRLRKASIYLDDCTGYDIERLCSSARQLRREHQAALVVVDEFALIRDLLDDPGWGRQRELIEVSRTLAGLARELGIPVVLTCRVHRSEDDCLRPRYSDLRKAGFQGADADTVIFLHRPGLYVDPPDITAPTSLIVAKSSAGPVGEVLLSFLEQCRRFEDYAPEGL